MWFSMQWKSSKLNISLFAVLRFSALLISGHYDCGGCKAAMENKKRGLIDNWLRHIRDVRAKHAKELEAVTDQKDRLSRLVELKSFLGMRVADYSVASGVNSMKRIPMVHKAMEQRGLEVHGWIYDVSNGFLKSLEVPQDPDMAYYQVE